MEAQRGAIARACQEAAYDGTMAFPAIVATLIQAGFDGYLVDYRRNTTIYYLADGDTVLIANRPADAKVAPDFDPVGIAAQVRWAQADPPDYSYAAFCRNVKALGCAGYLVSLSGRRVLYFGGSAETHVEHFPR